MVHVLYSPDHPSCACLHLPFRSYPAVCYEAHSYNIIQLTQSVKKETNHKLELSEFG